MDERWGPFLWGKWRDLGVFGLSFALPLALVFAEELAGTPDRALPEWAFLAFVVGVDVAHVYATLFRSYLDRDELSRHPIRYVLAPIAAYAATAALWQSSPLTLFRCLAYLAVFHFVRQQAGWVALYRARAGQSSWRTRLVDNAAIYSATLYPLLVWHAAPERRFSWFMTGDFIVLPALDRFLPVAQLVWFLSLLAFGLGQARKLVRDGRLDLGKCVIMTGTALTWHIGIITTNGDFAFTVTNVVPHGVPYLALLYFYARARRLEAPRLVGSAVVAGGLFAFLLLCVTLALAEEAAWSRWIFHDHPEVFGAGGELSRGLVAWLAPLLLVPQTVHYALDGLLWRRSDSRSRPAQRAALGFVAH